jgi:alcohol dehydrogenase
MLLGSSLAGLAIENSMLGAAHSAANPLTAHAQVAHGVAVGLLLPFVVRFNAADPATQAAYADLAVSAGLARSDAEPAVAVEVLIHHLQSLLDLAVFPRSLGHCGVQPSLAPLLATEAAAQWTAQFNPRPVAAGDFIGLYEAAFTPRKAGA